MEEATGNVYVVDRGNNRINVFSASGSFLFAFGTQGGGPGQFNAPTSIAIDNDPTSLSYQAVYVGTDNFRVQKFDRDGAFLFAFGTQGSGPGQFGSQSNPIAVGPGGTVYVGDGPPSGPRIERFAHTGAFLGASALPEPQSSLTAIAVDSSGEVYAAFSALEAIGIWKYELSEPTATLLNRFDFDFGLPRTRALAVGSADELFAFQLVDELGRDRQVITRYDASGATISRFAYGELEFNLLSLAVHKATGDLYGSEENVGSEEPGVGNKVTHVSSPPAGALVVPDSIEPDPVGNTKATLHAIINPEGKEADYHFEYVDEDTYQADIGAGGDGFGSAWRVPKNEGEDPAVGSTGDFGLHPVSAEIGCPDPANEAGAPESKCLAPETPYRFRVVAENEDGEGNSPVEGGFVTKPAVEIEAVWSSEVGTGSARVNAEVNPLGIPTTGYFEYVDDATYGMSGFAASRRTAEIDFGSGEGGQIRSAFLSGLAPGVHHFRVVVDDPLIEPVIGPERVFATQEISLPSPPCPNDEFRTGAATWLSNCRAYEMVSPVDKENGDIIAVGNVSSNPAQLNQSAAMGGVFTYSAYRAFGDAQSAPFTSQYFATRYPTAEHPAKEGWENHGISPARGINILSNQGTLDNQFKAFSPDLCTGWLLHDTDPPLAQGAVEGVANLYQRSNCGVDAYTAVTTVKPPNRDPKFFAPELQGISGDGSHAVFRADDQLTGNANPGKPVSGSNFQCYDASDGKTRLVSIMPNGTASKQSCSIGTAYDINDGRSDAVTNAISDDGSRIFWTASGGTGPGQIFVRVDGKNPTVAVSESVSKAAARFWTAAGDGSRAIFTIEDGATPGDDLHDFDVDDKQQHQIAGEVVGVVGASEDATQVYFVSREDLADGAGAGQLNLYLFRAGDGTADAFSFIAALASGDVPVNNNIPSPVSPEPYYHTARVSPDGQHLAFMSTARITDYDNVDANSGEADAEVYLYDATASAGAGEIACISCNPTGARPAGRELLRDNGFGTGVWAAAQIPGFASQLYAQRVLSAGGERLFFESYEGLVVRDTNGRQDVYQWERGTGRKYCEAKGAELFVEDSGGCISLISSGESAKDSEFVDASADGSDVFIATDSSLLPQDPGLIDIYDARIGGGFNPPPAPQPPCEGEACQSPQPPPREVTPASLAFHGKGNPRKSRPRCPKGKRKVRRKGKARCVRKQKRNHKGHRPGRAAQP